MNPPQPPSIVPPRDAAPPNNRRGRIAPIHNDRIVVGCRVSGCFGDFIPIDPSLTNANPNKRPRRSRQRLVGTVLRAAGENRWIVVFDNGVQRECASNTLVFVSSTLPPPRGLPSTAPRQRTQQAPQASQTQDWQAPHQLTTHQAPQTSQTQEGQGSSDATNNLEEPVEEGEAKLEGGTPGEGEEEGVEGSAVQEAHAAARATPPPNAVAGEEPSAANYSASAPGQAVPRGTNRIVAGRRVSGCFGDFLPLDPSWQLTNPNKRPRRSRQRLFGTVLRAVADHRWIVDFDNGLQRECASNTLTVVASAASLPPQGFSPQSVLLPLRRGEQQESYADDHRNEDNELEEHLPPPDDDNDKEGGPFTAEEGDEGQEAAAAQAESQEPLSHSQRFAAAKAEIAARLGEVVTIQVSSSSHVTWKVVAESEPSRPVQQREQIGLSGFDLRDEKDGGLPRATIIGHMFLHLMFINWRESLQVMNNAILQWNEKRKLIAPAPGFRQGRTTRLFSEEEFLTALALLIGSVGFGGKLWTDGDEDCHWDSIVPPAAFETHMKHYRFKSFRQFLPFIFHCPQLREKQDPWWQFAKAISDFNRRRREVLVSSTTKILDESMSAYRPRTTKTGNLPNISFILRKPEPLGKLCALLFHYFTLLNLHPNTGTELKSACCNVTGCMVALEIQRGKEGMSTQDYAIHGGTTACCLRIMDQCAKPIRERFEGDAWFGSVKAVAMAAEKGHIAFLQVKNNKALYPKEYIEKALKDMPGGGCILFLRGRTVMGLLLLLLATATQNGLLCFLLCIKMLEPRGEEPRTR